MNEIIHVPDRLSYGHFPFEPRRCRQFFLTGLQEPRFLLHAPDDRWFEFREQAEKTDAGRATRFVRELTREAAACLFEYYDLTVPSELDNVRESSYVASLGDPYPFEDSAVRQGSWQLYILDGESLPPGPKYLLYMTPDSRWVLKAWDNCGESIYEALDRIFQELLGGQEVGTPREPMASDSGFVAAERGVTSSQSLMEVSPEVAKFLLIHHDRPVPPELVPDGGRDEAGGQDEKHEDRMLVAGLRPCARAILRTLDRKAHRLTKKGLFDEINRNVTPIESEHSISNIIIHLKILMTSELIDNSQKGSPKGYGLTTKGVRVLRYLPA